jgi:hypothetical protein
MQKTSAAQTRWDHSLLRKISPRLRRSSEEWFGLITFRLQKDVSLSDTNAIQFSAFHCVARGGRSHVAVDPQQLFRAILQSPCDGFLLFHNHPSENPNPSPADLRMTAQVLQVSRLLDLCFFGHAIVAAQSLHWINLDIVSRDCYGPDIYELESEGILQS